MNSTSSRAVSWYYWDQFGFSKAPPLTDAPTVRNMAIALMTAASGDGELTPAEHKWLLGYFAAKGYPAAVIDEVEAMSRRDFAALPELMQLGILRASGRILLYDAIRVAAVDGATDGERAAIREAARLLAIDSAVVDQLEQIVADEQALKRRRIDLLMPDGHPNLDPRYVRP